MAWAAQIYCDFSGYSDLAMGCAKWFGFELPRNFERPYRATSITDFWRRWHLSLSTWLRDYVYFPLGGSKGSAARTYLNLTAVFVLCGLWHGGDVGVAGVRRVQRTADVPAPGLGPVARVRASGGCPPPGEPHAGDARVGRRRLGGDVLAGDGRAGADPHAVVGGGRGDARSARRRRRARRLVGGVPVWVPVLLGVVTAGHVFGGRRGLPAAVRAAGYVGMVVLVVTLSPGVGKTFIYLEF